jgi:predicted  nucleic acid-binding Zn-ribbon protein
MATTKQLKEAQRVAFQQKGIIQELQVLVRDIERCEKTITDLNAEIQTVNARHADRKTTQDDVHFLEDMLACAKKKLVWEKQLASLQKRTPDLMKRVESVVNHPESNPDAETREALLSSLNAVKAGIQRLSEAKG